MLLLIIARQSDLPPARAISQVIGSLNKTDIYGLDKNNTINGKIIVFPGLFSFLIMVTVVSGNDCQPGDIVLK
jgi:hypothetical protein